MKKKLNHRVLKLNKETLRTLDAHELNAHGGQTGSICSGETDVTCYESCLHCPTDPCTRIGC